MSDKELWDILYDEYKKHGNSMNGAQLTILSDNLKLMKQKFTNKEIGDMLKNDFKFYHYACDHLRLKAKLEELKKGENNV